ncbi:MAG: hypothetical protein IKL44_03300 [Clostridia bacterium]|nr:hypothetical protein [Clostridia bacterium]
MNITLSVERTAQIFEALSGEPAADHESLCATAARTISSLLKKGRDYRFREEELLHAAGCLAYYRYTLARQSEGTASYKAGDVSVTGDIKATTAAARALLDDALAYIADCLPQRGFCFKTV